MVWLVSLTLIVVFLLLVAVFAGAETGFVCLDLNHLKQLACKENAHSEKALLRIARQPDRFLALNLIGINMSVVIATSLATNVVEPYGPLCVALETLVMSLIIFFGCEVIPKMAFTANPLTMSLRALPVVEFFDRLLALPIYLVTAITRLFMQAFGLRGEERRKRQITRDELTILLSMGNASGTITDKPHRMARGVIGLKETRVCEIMVPRPRMVALDVNSSLEKVRAVFLDSGYSRIPVYEQTIDQVIGFVYFKDILLGRAQGKNLRDILAKVSFVPEVKNGFELFREMLSKKNQTAIVLDEYGATAGIVTLEDLIEEVVGEIHDELDEPASRMKFHGDGTMTMRADLNLSFLEEEAHLKFGNTENITTLNGLILERLGRIPVFGECLTIDGHRMEVVAADQKRIISVRVHPVSQAEEGRGNR
jgi:CBS domain containing-hemolysin-like protein